MGLIGARAGMWVCSDDVDNFKDELVEEGKAEYYLDENNERQWRLK